ncbi:MAG: amino acid adenylation domain-containing protein, partial [bacterium]|nr:amino acid adenylation domain-containing protein [bacterium]
TEVFRTPTIRGLSQYIHGASWDRYAGIEPVDKREYYDLSSPQKRIYIIHQMDLKSTAYNMPLFIPFEKRPSVEKLEDAFIKLINRHESLRTSFYMIDNQPVQKVHDHVDFEIECFGRGGHRGPPLQDFVRPFDLSHAPLLRVGTAKTDEGNHILMVDMHHIISDGISMGVLRTDFIALFQDETLPRLRLQYKDFTQWQNSRSEQKNVASQKSYWLGEFNIQGEIPVLQLPFDYPRPAVRSFEGTSFNYQLSVENSRGLRSVALETGSTLFMVFLSLTTVLLSKLSGQEDIVIGTPIAGRRHADLEDIIGMFVNTLSLRNYPRGGKTAKEFLVEVKEQTLKAFENQEYQFEDLVEQLPIERNTGRHPLFDVLFSFHTVNQGGIANSTGDSVPADTGNENVPDDTETDYRDYEYSNWNSKFDLTVTVVELVDTIYMNFNYCTALFKAETIQRFVNYFKIIVSLFLTNPETVISHIDVLPEEERERLLIEFNNTPSEYPREKSIIRLLQEQVQRKPGGIAAVGFLRQDREASVAQMTYDELHVQSGRLAGVLIREGVGGEEIVAVMTGNSIEMIIGILAVLKAGAAFLPLTPDLPTGRIDDVMKDSNVKVLMTAGEGNKPGKWRGRIIVIDMLPNSESIPVPMPPVSPSNLAYTIYTSGSTGRPKGVGIEHRNMVNYIDWYIREVGLAGEEKVLLTHVFTFDASFTNIFGALLSGSQLHVIPKEMYMDPDLLLDYISQQRITHFKFIPSLFTALVNHPGVSQKDLNCVRFIMLGGESIRVGDVQRFHDTWPQVAMMNHYGPTETTVGSIRTWLDWSQLEEFKQQPVIGKPINNTGVFILDRHLRPLPISVSGELYLAGDGIARGYLNRPELTNSKFQITNHKFQTNSKSQIPNKTSASSAFQSFIYKTGDLARWLTNGNVEFLGRADQQVKVRGYRIEMGEIENRLLGHSHIKEAIVIGRGDDKNGRYLCAYLVPVSGDIIPVQGDVVYPDPLAESDLREYLSKDLPDYMIPYYFVRLEAIPLTATGKVDRRALPMPRLKAGSDHIAPGSHVENQLARFWSEALEIEESVIGIDSNFFELGGHSLKATIMVSKIHKALNVKVPLTEVFRTPTIRQLAQYI